MSVGIEVRGIGFPNKGAELMLLAIQQHFSDDHFLPIDWVCAPKNDYIARSSYQLWQKAEVIKYGVNVATPLTFLPKKLRQFFGIKTPKEIDIIFDASGFAYGSQWGLDNTKQLAQLVKFWHKQQKKIILLPQAFGPFSEQEFASSLSIICEYADLIFARDADSYQHLVKYQTRDNLFQAPDFTNLVEAPKITVNFIPKNAVCVIPNQKMLVQGEPFERQYYLQFLIDLIQCAQALSVPVFLLSHDGQRDLPLIKIINQQLIEKIPYFIPDSPLTTKQYIQQAQVVISSRFHGLVSALTHEIPVIATSWSHKYRLLLRDYDVERHLFTTDDQQHATLLLNRLLSDKSFYKQVQHKIHRNNQIQRKLSFEMWQQVDYLLTPILYR